MAEAKIAEIRYIGSDAIAPVTALVATYSAHAAALRERTAITILRDVRRALDTSREFKRHVNGEWPSDGLLYVISVEQHLTELLGCRWPLWPHETNEGLDYLCLERRRTPSPQRIFQLFTFEILRGADSTLSSKDARELTEQVHEQLGCEELPLTFEQTLKDIRAELAAFLRRQGSSAVPSSWSLPLYEAYRREAMRLKARDRVWFPAQ